MQKFSFGNLPKVLILKSIFETIFEFELNLVLKTKQKRVWKMENPLSSQSSPWSSRPALSPRGPLCVGPLPFLLALASRLASPSRSRAAHSLLSPVGSPTAATEAQQRCAPLSRTLSRRQVGPLYQRHHLPHVADPDSALEFVAVPFRMM